MNIKEMNNFKKDYLAELKNKGTKVKLEDEHIQRWDKWAMFVFNDVKYSFMWDTLVKDIDTARRDGYMIVKDFIV